MFLELQAGLLALLLHSSISFLLPSTSFRRPSATLEASLSHLTSSPERYAASLGLSIEEMKIAKADRIAKSQALHDALQSKDLNGPQKHAIQCQHVMAHGQHPFVCPTCWTYLPICVCTHKVRYDIPVQQVILWTHHDEWGSVANTGSVLPLVLKDVSLKLKGLPEHDAWFDEILHDPTILPIVLWPDHHQYCHGQKSYYSIEDLLLRHQRKKIVLIAIEGTWRNARRMVSKLNSVGLVGLTQEQMFGWRRQPSDGSLRSQGNFASPENACTAEAVVGALVALGMDPNMGETVLQRVAQKMDLTRRYQGHDC